MEPLNKLILNNKIVDMRHSVRQSRIQSINKLVKEIKKLRDKKGTDEQKVKNARKAERYVECIQIMKKVKEDDVSKFALMNEKGLAQITNDINETPEIKAIARICDRNPVYKKVKAFREKYPDWKETLPLLFDSLGERYQEKKKKSVSKNKAKSTDRRAKSSPENVNKTAAVTYIKNSLGTWRVEEIVPSKEKTNQYSEFDKDYSIENRDVTNKYSCNETKRLAKKENIKKDKNSNKLKETDVDRINEKRIVREETVKKLSKENENPLIEEKITRTVDPFFVTKDNKEYLSISIANNTSNIEEKKPDFPSKEFKKEFSKPMSHEKNWRQSKIDVSKKYPKIETKEETLHPSWEAKRKQCFITEFQGKKIKFDN